MGTIEKIGAIYALGFYITLIWLVIGTAKYKTQWHWFPCTIVALTWFASVPYLFISSARKNKKC